MFLLYRYISHIFAGLLLEPADVTLYFLFAPSKTAVIVDKRNVKILTYKTIGQELVDRGKGKACDWSSGVLRADHFKEGPQENVGFNI